MTNTETTTNLPCTCGPDVSPGSYTIGCPFHTDAALHAPPYVHARTNTHTVTYWHADVTISTPVLRDGEVWSQQDYVRCDHHHVTKAAADRCGDAIASRLRRPGA